MISKSLESYLKTMYVLKKQNGNIRVTDIANKMQCTKPSVNKALNNLKLSGMITYEAYGPVELTQEGEKLARKALETYDTVYLFFKEVLDLEEEQAESQAEKVKMVISDEAVNKLKSYVHKVLDLNDIGCCYDEKRKECKTCKKAREAKFLLKNKEREKSYEK